MFPTSRTSAASLTSPASPTRGGAPRSTSHATGRDRLHRLRRRIAWHRRWWAAGLAAAAVFTTVQALRPSEPETANVLVAAQDLPAGRTLERSDVERTAYARDTVPAGALSAEKPPTGRTLAAPIRAGTPLTDRALVGRPLLRALGAGTVAAPARIADPELLDLVRVGDRVDVVAGEPAGSHHFGESLESTEPARYGQARVLARSARVLAIHQDPDDGPLAGGAGGLVLLAVAPDTALTLAGAGPGLTLILHGSGP